MGVIHKAIGVLVCVFVLAGAGCVFKKAQSIGVMSYRGGRVFLQNRKYYRVGILPEGWRRMDTKARAVSWYNESYKSSITTDAFCGKSFSDRPLDTLAGELSSALSNDRTTTSSQKMMLDERGALRLSVTGTMDGVTVVMDIVVVKKDGCNFDFVAVMPPDAPDQVISDFEAFFMGFHY